MALSLHEPVVARSSDPRPGVIVASAWLLWIMVVLEAAFAIGLLLTEGQDAPLVNIGLAEATQWVPVAIFWLVAVRTSLQRWDVILAAIAVTVSAMGDFYYSVMVESGGALPLPSPADVGYLLFYPFMVASLIALMRRQSRGAGRLVALDSAVGALGAAAVLAVVLGPVLDDAFSGVSALEGAVAIAYPLFDLLLIAMIVGLASSPNIDIGPRWGFLVGGLGIFTAGDVAYALLDHNGAYVVGTPLDSVWALGLALIAWWVDGIGRYHPRRPARPRSFVFPAAAVAVASGLAVLILATQIRVSPVAMGFASATVVLAAVPVMFRQAVLTRLLAGQARVVEQLRELDRAKSEMMATINHELRTPLTSIRGYLELVNDGEGGKVPNEAAQMLRVAAHNAGRLEALVDDMTMLSRLEEGDDGGERAPVSVLGILTHAREAVYPTAAARSIAVNVEGVPGLLVAADGGQLEHAFTKIAENAVKFTKDGGQVQLRVETGGTAAHRTAIVTFVDSGIGIPTADIEKVFSPFFRAANAQSDAIAGAGLGLSIVRYIVEAHDGQITVSSTEGVGTRVQVELPVVSATEH